MRFCLILVLSLFSANLYAQAVGQQWRDEIYVTDDPRPNAPKVDKIIRKLDASISSPNAQAYLRVEKIKGSLKSLKVSINGSKKEIKFDKFEPAELTKISGLKLENSIDVELSGAPGSGVAISILNEDGLYSPIAPIPFCVSKKSRRETKDIALPIGGEYLLKI